MSRIGCTPIAVPEGIDVSLERHTVVIKGPKGELRRSVPESLSVTLKEGYVRISRIVDDKSVRALHGAYRAHLANDIVGVRMGWSKTLELSGVGYRAAMVGSNLELTIGFSHPVTIAPPPGITLAIVEGAIIVSGIDKTVVGQAASNIRAVKKPEPYKGKGIRYKGEHIRRKAGKSAKAVGGAPGGKP